MPETITQEAALPCRRTLPLYVSPHEMTDDKEYILVAHFALVGETRFFGPFRPIVPISHDQLVRGTYCAKVVYTEEGDRAGALMLPSGGSLCMLSGRVEYSLYEYTRAFAVRVRNIGELRNHQHKLMEHMSKY